MFSEVDFKTVLIPFIPWDLWVKPGNAKLKNLS